MFYTEEEEKSDKNIRIRTPRSSCALRQEFERGTYTINKALFLDPVFLVCGHAQRE